MGLAYEYIRGVFLVVDIMALPSASVQSHLPSISNNQQQHQIDLLCSASSLLFANTHSDQSNITNNTFLFHQRQQLAVRLVSIIFLSFPWPDSSARRTHLIISYTSTLLYTSKNGSRWVQLSVQLAILFTLNGFRTPRP